MFGLIKKIFKKDGLQEGVMAPTSAPAYSRTATPGQSRHPNPFSNDQPKGPHAAPSSPPTKSSSALAAKPKSTIPQSPSGGSEILLPLKELVESLPDDVRKLFSVTIPENAQLKLDQNVILPQLAGGRVKVHLGTVRNQISNGIYLGSPEQDHVEANIPLPMIIPRINPAKLPRRGQRLAMDVPEEVTGLFGTIGEPLPTSARLPENPAPAAPAPNAAPGNTPLPPNKTTPTSPAKSTSGKDHRQAVEALSNSPSIQPKRQSVREDLLEDIPSPFAFGQAPAPANTKPATPQAVPKPPSATPLPPSESGESIKFDSEKFFKKETSRHPFAPREEKTAEPPKKHSDAIPMPGTSRSKDSVPKPPSAAPAPHKPGPKPAPAPQPVPSQSSQRVQEVMDENYIHVTVTEASEGWPEPILNEIQQYNLATAKIALPFGEVDMTMRKGRVEFTWKQLRNWIAGGGTPASTENDDVSLLIPLKVVAPKFLTQRQPRNKQQQVKVEESIPDVFSGAPEPEPEPTVSAKTAPALDAEAAAPTEEASPSTAKAAAKPSPQQVKVPKISAGNPKDLVEKTSALPGVDGALLAMHDGLVVASQLKKPLVSETVAAFLPQIFARLTQFATEIKLGELSSVMMVAGNCPWIIFRTNKVYFAVVGKPGEALPLAQLTAIVADINKQNL